VGLRAGLDTEVRGKILLPIVSDCRLDDQNSIPGRDIVEKNRTQN
jgi:hypothetical protein